jgi:ribosomal protein S27AE
MKARTAACPACGAPVEFKVSSSFVTVCEFCQSAVARADRKVEDHGKVADLVQTDSPLRRGLGGKFNGKHFSILGRVQYAHPAGGVWNEWYLAFPGDRWGWLAEAQGKLYLTFSRQLSSTIQLPTYESLQTGRPVKLGKAEFTVTEKGIATAVAAEGEIPWAFRPGADHRFADLVGPDGTFATFEYGEHQAAFTGKEVALADLQLEGDGWTQETPKVAVSAMQLNCPKCGGPLTLRAPDQSERVTCGNCNSLLDASQGKLQYFATLRNEKLQIVIPLGKEGTLFGTRYTVIGFMSRFTTYQGTTYPWSEYLLYNRESGFRWLVHNDNHWSFVETLTAQPQVDGTYARLDGEKYRIYDRGTAYVRSVVGEFYWRVAVGEQTQTADYIAPPRMLSIERTETAKSSEVVVSRGVYVPHTDIEQAFGLKDLTRPWSIAPNQPRPEVGYGVFGLWFVFLFIVLFLQVMFSKTSDPWLAFYAIIFVSLIPVGILIFFHSFEVKRWSNSDYSPYASSE